MFIKRDRRKIDEIMSDSSDKRESLSLSKRTAEFNGTVRALCREAYLPSLMNLRTLNLYDCSLTDLSGMGIVSNCPIEEINLGNNALTNIPIEFGALVTLKKLWLDDNHFESLPLSVCRLTQLQSLRLSQNSLTDLPTSISSLISLETLALDGNQFEEVPTGVTSLTNLKHLWLRQNKLTYLPESISSLTSLMTLSISSNQLDSLPDSLQDMVTLTKIYANGNQISSVPEGLCLLPNLEELNLANNELTSLPEQWREVWGSVGDNGILTQSSNATTKTVVNVMKNPFKQTGNASIEG